MMKWTKKPKQDAGLSDFTRVNISYENEEEALNYLIENFGPPPSNAWLHEAWDTFPPWASTQLRKYVGTQSNLIFIPAHSGKICTVTDIDGNHRPTWVHIRDKKIAAYVKLKWGE